MVLKMGCDVLMTSLDHDIQSEVFMFHEFSISISVVVTDYAICCARDSLFRIVYTVSYQTNVGIALQFPIFNIVCFAVKFQF